MKFFDTTPLGRIINRFSRDVDTLDNNLSDTLRNFLLFSGQIVAVFVLTIACFPFFAIALGALTLLFAVSVRYYLASAREVKRFEAVLRSHVFTRFTESIDGIPTIRAYGLVEQFSNLLKRTIDEMDGAYFLTFANQSWLSIRLDAIGNLMVLIIGILVVTSRLSVDPSISGFVLSYFMSVVQYLQYSVRQYAEVQNSMNSVERLHFYGNEIEQEAATETANLRSTWPEEGKIVFQDVEMRYRKDLPLVLHGFSAQIKAGERIGVVGRTGAGKSSLISTLFRMTELSGGFITIDGLDISKIGLKTLRSRLTIIPQEPTLFRGTIRSNLDPFDSHSDLELWSALRQAGLTGEGQNSIGTKGERVKLDARVDEGGGNFSLGQRQLLALARALVRSSQIIVCDEATSSVDFDTDRRVQQAMIEGFKGKTLLCIAHRLKTVIGYDRICVLDAGKAVEFDTPLTLWKKGGIFRGMCDNSGIARTEFNKDDGYL
jgi:ABC-type multidrug transport system fused ATPase/permease subunit